MKPKILFTLIASFAFLFVFHQSAYAEKYAFRNYSVDDGLPSSFVRSILQDRHGYLWFGTWGGACKFDGTTFTPYTIEDGLVSNWVNTIIEDKKGNLWFGTNAGVSRFDRENWITYTTEDGLAYNQISAMLEDSQGNLWIGSLGYGVSRFDGANWTTYTTEDGLADNIVRSIFEDSRGNLWFSLENEGASRFDGKNWTSFPPGDGVPVHAKAILEDRQGNFWIAGFYSGMGLGVAKIAGRPGSGDYTVFSSKDGLTIGYNCSFIEDSQGNIWLGSEYGLVRFDSENWQVYTMENGLNSNYITSMIEDREGNLWFTNTGGGASRLSGTAFTTFTTADGLPNNSLDPALEDAEGNLWFTDWGTADGVTRYDGENWITYTTEEGLGGNRIRGKGVIEDSKGNLWFACGGGGLSRFDGKKWTTCTAKDWGGEGVTWAREIHMEDKKGNIWFNAGALLSLMKFDGKNWTDFSKEKGFAAVVLSILEDKNGNLWFRTTDGVTKYDGKKLSNYSTEEGRVLDGEEQIFEDKKGSLWFITVKGLTCFDGENWKTYTTEDGLAGNELLAIHEDASGNLWLGTNGGGISKYDGSQFTSFTTEHGISSNVCEFILEHDSYLYFGTPEGINRFDGETFKIYTSNDGLAATDVWTSLKDSKGNLWFGTENGVTRFDPSLDRPNLVPPPVYINRLRIFEKDTTVTSGLELVYKENNLMIDYVGISLTSPEDVVYNYKLEGLDEDWHETGEHYISYPYLPPGDYTFKVKARNRDGIWSEKTAELVFAILPPFWATNWFRGSIIALVLLAFWGFYTARTRNMKRRSQELERKVNERTRELRDKTAQLIQAEKMASLGSLVAGLAHEINTPLGALKSNVDVAFRNMRDIKGLIANLLSKHKELSETEENKKLNKLFVNTEKQADVSRKASNRVSAVINSLRSFARIDQAVRATVDIHEGLETTLTLVQHEIKERIKVHKDYGDLPKITCYPDRLNQIYMNLVVNAIHAIDGKGEIFIRTCLDRDWTVVEIRDTGRGIPKEKLAHIFDPGFTTKGVGVGTGLGLSIVYQIVQDHKGRVEVESEPGRGSVFRVYLPVK